MEQLAVPTSPYNPFSRTSIEELLSERYIDTPPSAISPAPMNSSGAFPSTSAISFEPSSPSSPSPSFDTNMLYNISAENLLLSEDDFYEKLTASLTDFEFYDGVRPALVERHIFRASITIARCAVLDLGIEPVGGLILPFVALTLYTMASPYKIYRTITHSMNRYVVEGEDRLYRRFKFLIDNLLIGFFQLPDPNYEHFFSGQRVRHSHLWKIYLTSQEQVPRRFDSIMSFSNDRAVSEHYMNKWDLAHSFPVASALDPSFGDREPDTQYRVMFNIIVDDPSRPPTRGFKEIQPFSWFPDESETLFLPGTAFVIDSVEICPNEEAAGGDGWVEMKLKVIGQTYRVQLPEELRELEGFERLFEAIENESNVIVVE